MTTSTASWVLPSHASSVARARRYVGEACTGLPDELVQTTLLLTSEVVSNAVAHGKGRPRMSLMRCEDHLRVEVEDEGTGRPQVSGGDRGALSESGRGLNLLEALASEWGTAPCDPVGTGNRVWFQMRTAS